jgi:predicted nucleic acid-binding Zn finger protein
MLIFDSFSWDTKILFKDAMSKTIQHMSDIVNFDNAGKISLEQQICLMKAPENVKERALQKLKEIKSKSDDSGSKARQYLDGLLKIPFGFYRTEPILYLMSSIKNDFLNFIQKYNSNSTITNKTDYNNLEIITYLKKYKTDLQSNTITELDKIRTEINSYDKPSLTKIIDRINQKNINLKLNFQVKYILLKTSTKKTYILYINDFIDYCTNTLTNYNIVFEVFDKNQEDKLHIQNIKDIEDKYNKIQKYMVDVRSILNNSVHGHDNAKNQIEQIIGQWIN